MLWFSVIITLLELYYVMVVNSTRGIICHCLPASILATLLSMSLQLIMI